MGFSFEAGGNCLAILDYKFNRITARKLRARGPLPSMLLNKRD
jgi:hypothetical protein